MSYHNSPIQMNPTSMPFHCQPQGQAPNLAQPFPSNHSQSDMMVPGQNPTTTPPRSPANRFDPTINAPKGPKRMSKIPAQHLPKRPRTPPVEPTSGWIPRDERKKGIPKHTRNVKNDAERGQVGNLQWQNQKMLPPPQAAVEEIPTPFAWVESIEDLRVLLSNTLVAKKIAEDRLSHVEDQHTGNLSLLRKKHLDDITQRSRDLVIANSNVNRANKRVTELQRDLQAISSAEAATTWERKFLDQQTSITQQEAAWKRMVDILKKDYVEQLKEVQGQKEASDIENQDLRKRMSALIQENESLKVARTKSEMSVDGTLINTEVRYHLREQEKCLSREIQKNEALEIQLKKHGDSLLKFQKENETLETVVTCYKSLNIILKERDLQLGRVQDTNKELRASISVHLSENNNLKALYHEREQELLCANTIPEELRHQLVMLEIYKVYSLNHQPRKNLNHIYFNPPEANLQPHNLRTATNSDILSPSLPSIVPQSSRRNFWSKIFMLLIISIGGAFLLAHCDIGSLPFTNPSGVGIFAYVSQGQGSITLAGGPLATQLKGLMETMCFDEVTCVISDHSPIHKKAPSVSSLARLRAVMESECGSYQNMGPDAEIVEKLGSSISCMFRRAWRSLREMLD